MGADEEGTLAALKSHRRELVDPKIAEHNGRIVKTTGDGMLVEFASVLDAVRCCVEFQRAMADRNSETPADRQMLFRVGINLGDIIIDEDDIHGDGVNVAARLEALAKPGGICVSRTVRNQVRDKMDITFEDMGEVEVKNIARPVKVFRVLQQGEEAKLPKQQKSAKWKFAAAAVVLALLAGGGAWWWQQPDFEPADPAKMAYALPEKPSIAVLPFDNYSGDKEQEYFADGMVEDLITDLSKVSGLFVIARTSSFTYKGKAVKVQQDAEDLGVRYVVEGSVRRVGDIVRINVQVIDALSGYHVWAERYDGAEADSGRWRSA